MCTVGTVGTVGGWRGTWHGVQGQERMRHGVQVGVYAVDDKDPKAKVTLSEP